MEDTCRYCSCPFGNHAADCFVKWRDEMNRDPEVQRGWQRLDEYYEAVDDAKALDEE